MSRSWERKVRKNTSHLNKQRKKSGQGQYVPNAEQAEKFKGRNYAAPILLILFVALFNMVMWMDPEFQPTTLHWLTVVSYFGLAALFYFRRPYLTIGKDYIQSRRFTGHKTLKPSDIKQIRVQKGYVFITPNKGTNWGFSRLLNRFQTDEMTESLKAFAVKHQITFEEL